jgi:ketosteroid isomerase-like protein
MLRMPRNDDWDCCSTLQPADFKAIPFFVRSLRLAVRTSPSHGENRSSILLGSAKAFCGHNHIMVPSPAERDDLLKGFARALFKGDIDALYKIVTPDFHWTFDDGLVVTKSLAGPAAIAEHLAEQKALFSAQRFHDVAHHHAGEMTFMTFRVSETLRATGEQREQRGIESYTFADGRLATKDVYRKPIML